MNMRSAPQERDCKLKDIYLNIMRREKKNKIIERFKVNEICQEVYENEKS